MGFPDPDRADLSLRLLIAMNKIITALDIAQRDGLPNWVTWIHAGVRQNGYIQTPFTGRIAGPPIAALIDRGRWVAKCECGGTEYVCVEEPIFYCFSCANWKNGGNGRKVVFPDDELRAKIEAALLARPVIPLQGRFELERLINATPANLNLHRQWLPGVTLNELLAENEAEGIKS